MAYARCMATDMPARHLLQVDVKLLAHIEIVQAAGVINDDGGTGKGTSAMISKTYGAIHDGIGLNARVLNRGLKVLRIREVYLGKTRHIRALSTAMLLELVLVYDIERLEVGAQASIIRDSHRGKAKPNGKRDKGNQKPQRATCTRPYVRSRSPAHDPGCSYLLALEY
jgi:hypothetical protein